MAGRLAELVATAAGTKDNGLLNLGILPTAQTPPGDGRRLQLDSRIHAPPPK